MSLLDKDMKGKEREPLTTGLVTRRKHKEESHSPRKREKKYGHSPVLTFRTQCISNLESYQSNQ